VVAGGLAALACMLLAAGPGTGASNADRELRPRAREAASPTLASTLGDVARAQSAGGHGLAKARELGLRVDGGRVRVVVEPRGGAPVADAVRASGGQVEATYAGRVQALVPPAALEELSRASGVGYVRPPGRLVAQAVTGEEIAASTADRFQAALWTGAGVKVAVIGLGFAGVADRQASGDLPADLTTQDFCGGAFSTATDHDTAVAEIVHEVAPGAQLYLICVDSTVTLGQAVEYAKANGISIINTSITAVNESRGDGNGGPGTIDAIAADARANGILWVASAGNYQQAHWSGTFNGGGNFVDVHDFAPGDETNNIVISAGQTGCAYLKWDAWPTTVQDYDMYLLNGPDPATATIVAGSENDQSSGPLPPTEEFCYTNSGATATFYLIIVNYSASAAPRFDLFVDADFLEHRVPSGSITELAGLPTVMAVGAACWQSGSLRGYSSLGPTIDGRVKPDIVGVDGVSTATYGASSGCTGGFMGTSASSPEVAGLAALAKEQNPSLSPAGLQQWLGVRAFDISPAGKDNSTGAGRAYVYTFTDTPPWSALQSYVEQLFTKGTTTGCSALNANGTRLYCPNQPVTRRDMAVFIVRSLGLAPLDSPTPTFADVPASTFGYGEVERFYAQGITTGCTAVPLQYCPLATVTRRDMAVFIVRANGLAPLDSPTPTFADVPASMFGYGQVERFYEQGITTGCAVSPLRYCPLDTVDRRAMAAFLIRAFGAPTT
jgi:hypothetical protein